MKLLLSNITVHRLIGIPDMWLFWSLTLVVVFVAFGLYTNKISNKRLFTLWILLIEYVLIVFCATVICRDALSNRRIVFLPFWIYVEVLSGNPKVSPLDILFNILLLFPVGVLLVGVLPRLKMLHVFVVGFIMSLTIESLQYVFCKGVAQLDDLIHNSLGCVLGWYLSKRYILKSWFRL